MAIWTVKDQGASTSLQAISEALTCAQPEGSISAWLLSLIRQHHMALNLSMLSAVAISDQGLNHLFLILESRRSHGHSCGLPVEYAPGNHPCDYTENRQAQPYPGP